MRLVSVCSLLAIAAVAATGCLEPLVSDEPGASTHIQPQGYLVPHVSTSADLTRQIRVNDGLADQALLDAGGVVKLKSGFAAGSPIQYWDFGDVNGQAGVLFRLVEKTGDVVTPLHSPYIVNALPGDAGYSPLWLVQDVVVTEHYHGEVLASVEALTDAVDLGLIEEPVPALLYMDGPIVAQGTVLDMGMGQPTRSTTEVYAHGYRADMFFLGGATPLKVIAKAGKLPKGDVHMVSLGNAVSPMKTPLFQNLSTPWTPMVRVINCRATPPDATDPTTILTSETQLFTRDMMGNLAQATGRVISWQLSTSNKNWPILAAEMP